MILPVQQVNIPQMARHWRTTDVKRRGTATFLTPTVIIVKYLRKVSFRENDSCPTAVHSIVVMYDLFFLVLDPISCV